MEKKPFRYRNRIIAIIWILAVGIPLVLFLPEIILSSFAGNIIVSIGLVFFLWRIINKLPGVSKVGYYGKENGVTQIEYAGKSLRLNHVNSIFLSDKSTISQGVILQIQNNGKKINFLSAPMTKSAKVEDTDLYTIFVQILSENQSLVQEKDLQGEPIKYWYKS